MARITVEDCIDKVENRFELVLVASQRARKIGSGAPITVDRDKDKNAVVSLREIAAETVIVGDLKEDLVRNHQRMVAYEDDEDPIDLMDGEEEWGSMAAPAEGSDGLYEDENVDLDAEQADPSLEDLAGQISE